MVDCKTEHVYYNTGNAKTHHYGYGGGGLSKVAIWVLGGRQKSSLWGNMDLFYSATVRLC